MARSLDRRRHRLRVPQHGVPRRHQDEPPRHHLSDEPGGHDSGIVPAPAARLGRQRRHPRARHQRDRRLPLRSPRRLAADVVVSRSEQPSLRHALLLHRDRQGRRLELVHDRRPGRDELHDGCVVAGQRPLGAVVSRLRDLLLRRGCGPRRRTTARLVRIRRLLVPGGPRFERGTSRFGRLVRHPVRIRRRDRAAAGERGAADGADLDLRAGGTSGHVRRSELEPGRPASGVGRVGLRHRRTGADW